MYRVTLYSQKIYLLLTLVVFLIGFHIDIGAQQNPENHTDRIETLQTHIERGGNTISVRPLSHSQLSEKYFVIGIEFAERGHSIQAIEQFQISLRYDENNSEAVIAMSKLYYKDKKYVAAIPSLSAVLNFNPSHDEIATQLAYHFSALHQYDNVVSILSNRTGNRSSDNVVSSLLAYAYINTKKYKQAKAIYQNLLRVHPDDIASRMGEAISLEGEGDVVLALQGYAQLKSKYTLGADLTRFVNQKILRLHEQQQSNSLSE